MTGSTVKQRLSSGPALGSLCAVLLITCAMATQERPATFGTLLPRSGAFDWDAGGAVARLEHEWRIELDGPEPITVPASAVRCDADLYLVDTRGGVVHHVDLAALRRVDVIGVARDGTRYLKSPLTAAIDCGANTLYVVDSNGVNVFDTRSKEFQTRFPHPPGFNQTSQSAAILDAQSKTLYVPGLWPRTSQPWLVNGRDAMFVGSWIGYVLNLADGRVSPGFPAIDKGCWSWTPDCVSVIADRGSDGIWAVAHMVGTDIATFDGDGTLIRRIDVRSDLFRRSGARLLRSAARRDKFSWHYANSVLPGLFRFDGLVATIHVHFSTEHEGKLPNVDVFMNLHRLDGTGILSDVRLPGLPLFRDDRSLYMVDYGSAGRHPIGLGPFTIVSVPVLDARGNLHAALRAPTPGHATIVAENRR